MSDALAAAEEGWEDVDMVKANLVGDQSVRMKGTEGYGGFSDLFGYPVVI